jgi:hypothetical protein
MRRLLELHHHTDADTNERKKESEERKKKAEKEELQNRKKNLIATFNGKLKDVEDMAGLKKLFGEFVEKAKPLGETTVNAIVSAKDKKKAELDASCTNNKDNIDHMFDIDERD